MLFFLALTYLILGPDGSDQYAYEAIHLQNCEGKFVKGIEPWYQLSFIYISSVFGCLELEYHIALIIFPFTILLGLSLSKIFPKKDVFYVWTVIVMYLVTFQVAFNYRSGLASLLFLVAVFNLNNLSKLMFFALAVATHVQTLPAAILYSWTSSTSKFRYLLVLFGGIAIFSATAFLNSFVWQQGMSYLYSYSGSVRLASIPFLFLYIFVLLNLHVTNMKFLKPLFQFGLLMNLLFIFNSHIAARLTRPIEVLLFVCLFFIFTNHKKISMSRNLALLTCLLPGACFMTISFYRYGVFN